MREESTAALVKRASAGSAGAYELLVRRHLRAAFAVALAVLRNPAEAEDVAQEALSLAWEKLHECREPDRFGGWLLNMTRNLARNSLEKRKVRAAYAITASADEGTAETVSSDLDARTRLLAALERLGDTQREVVLLHDLEGWTHAEIAQALELSEVSSRQYLFTARKTMRTLLDGEATHGP